MGPLGWRAAVGPAAWKTTLCPDGLRTAVSPATWLTAVDPVGLKTAVGPAGLRTVIGPADCGTTGDTSVLQARGHLLVLQVEGQLQNHIKTWIPSCIKPLEWNLQTDEDLLALKVIMITLGLPCCENNRTLGPKMWGTVIEQTRQQAAWTFSLRTVVSPSGCTALGAAGWRIVVALVAGG